MNEERRRQDARRHVPNRTLPRGEALRGVVLALLAVTTPAVGAPAQEAQPSGAAPAIADAVQNYRIGAGDILDVRVLGQEQMSGTVRVSNTGFIRVPFVDEEIRALCRTEGEVSTLIEEKLRKYLKFPQVHVAVKDFVGNPVYVAGAVSAPQQLRSARRLNLLEAIILAGGLKEKAGSIAFIVHSGAVTACDPATAAARTPGSEIVSLSRLSKGDISENRLLEPGDIVIVPEADVVFISGEVMRPNAYALSDGLTLSKLMALAGGATGIAKTDQVRIVRQEPGKPRTELVVDFKDVLDNKQPDPVLLANDVIEVPSSTGKKILNGFLSTVGGSVGSLPVRAVP